MHLADAYSLCEQVVRQHSSSFYRAFSVLPEEKRNAVWAIYAFCRTVDDIVDVSPDTAPQLLHRFEMEFEQMLAGMPLSHPYWLALADVFQRYPMDPEPFRHMIEGQKTDLSPRIYQTYQELETYCYLVAGTVGLMLLPVLTPIVTDELKDKAVRLGIAMQITNILRDVAEDYGNGRVYLPLEWMDRFGYRAESIPLGKEAAGWAELFRHAAETAEEHYREGLSTAVHYPRDSRVALAAAGLIYRQILVEAVKRGGDVFADRVYVPNWKKLGILCSLFSRPMTWKKYQRPSAAVQGPLSC